VLDAEDLACAERVLGDRRGDGVVLREVDEFRPGRVVRCAVGGDGVADGETVVVKVPERGDGAGRDLATLHNELAALTLLSLVGSSAAATLLAADAETGVLVLEDLGDGPSLATALLGSDAAVAADAAVLSATALGALHAQTVGFAAQYDEVRGRLGPFDREADLYTLRGRDLRTCIADLPALLDRSGLPGLGGCQGDLDVVLQELAEPGDFLALSGGDPCPDNERTGAGGVRFIDFEAAAYRHALVDAAHFVIPFPNCWCWRRLPDDLAQQMLDTHREALAVSSAQARDADRYWSALTRAAGAWALWTLARRLPAVMADDLARTRTVEALTAFSRRAHEHDELPALRRFCDDVAARLQERWPATAADTYPAFGGAPWRDPV
jgi:hypothetical protein